MAVACSSMDLHDRRLSVSKASASKIGKPSPPPSLKTLAAASASASSSSSASFSHCQLPSSITSSPSRPISKVVNADPSTFRRVVQELTGTASTSSGPNAGAGAGASPRGPSRLHRMAPPPLHTGMHSNSFADHPSLPHQPTLLDQMQHHRDAQVLLLQQHIPKVGSSASPPFSFPEVCYPISNPTPHLENPSIKPVSEEFPQLENPNQNFSHSLPMLSPYLLSALPALTPGDSAWASPIEASSLSPKYMASATISVPSLMNGFPTTRALISNRNGHSDRLLLKPGPYAALDEAQPRHQVSQTANSLEKSRGQHLPSLVLTPLQSIPVNGVLPPWSPSPLPFSPGPFPLSPGPGQQPSTGLHIVDNLPTNSHIKYGSCNPAMPDNFTF